MSELYNSAIELPPRYGRISSTWINGKATWVCDYYPLIDDTTEHMDRQSRTMDLIYGFREAMLSEPTIEIEPTGKERSKVYSKHLPSVLGTHVLRVTNWLIPDVPPNPTERDPYYMHRIAALRPSYITPQDYERQQVENALSAGGQVIYKSFWACMTDSDPRR